MTTDHADRAHVHVVRGAPDEVELAALVRLNEGAPVRVSVECSVENAELRGKIQRYEDVIQHNNLWHFFRPRREKTAMRDDAR